MNVIAETRNLTLWTAETVAEAVPEPLAILDRNMKIRTANAAFCRAFRVTMNEIRNQSLFSVSQGRWDISALRELLERVLSENKLFEDLEIEQEFPGIGLSSSAT